MITPRLDYDCLLFTLLTDMITNMVDGMFAIFNL